MNRKIYAVILATLVCLAFGLLTSCSSSSSKTPPVVLITAASGSGQTATVGAAFAQPLVANVTTGGTPTSGVAVAFAAPSTGASCALSAASATTDANGNASVTCTANSTTGAYNVTATATGATTGANFAMTNSAVPTANYVFYLSGQETINGGDNYYAIAGVVTIDQNENIVGGEQDYNDAFGITAHDSISATGSALSVDATGQGTLTLNTGDANIGNPAGTEVFGIQAVNTSHILIVQYDGTATSSGSIDLQTATSVADGGYAFTLSGVDTAYNPVAYGGVFSSTGGAATGIADLNDGGTTATGQTFTGTFAGTDATGFGSLTGVTIDGTALTLNYYVVGPEVIRIINVDVGSDTPGTGGAAVGSAFGQGSGNTFTTASLPTSVFALQADPFGYYYAAAGTLAIPSPATGSFTGEGDVDELGTPLNVPNGTLTGSYSISNAVSGTTYNGYSTLTLTAGQLEDVSALGMYMTDPLLNLSDPNNTSGGGGALLLDLDSGLAGGIGIVIPQTDTAAADFTGTYAFGGQDLNDLGDICPWCGEFDFVGVGTVASGVFSGTGPLSDPFGIFTGTPAETPATFAGTAVADADEATTGRYTMSPTAVTPTGDTAVDVSLVIYQASGNQLLMMENDANALMSGTVQVQGSLTGKRAAFKPGRTQAKHKK